MLVARNLLLLLLIFACARDARGVDTVTFRQTVTGTGGPTAPEQTATGQILQKFSEGGMIFEADDGALRLLPGEDVVRTESDDQPFEPVSSEVLGERLLAELPEGFRIHTTEHYVIVYDTSREYAEWTSSLLERLHKTLVAYWRKQGIELTEPRFPLPVLIHRTHTAYQAASRRDGVGSAAVGYYNLRNNRIRMYDLTGSDAQRASGATKRRGSRREITRMLTTPAAEPLVATIVHEATHQVAYNTGLMQRFADLPLWLVEGMAVYFEAPESGSSRGWRGIGKVNYRRLHTFRRHLSEWNATTLLSLIANDQRIRDPRTGGKAYADAWALNYYLIKRRPKDYVAYVKAHATRPSFPPIEPGGPEADARRRVALFVEHFGSIEKLSPELLKYMAKL